MTRSWCGLWLVPLLVGLLALGGCNQGPDRGPQHGAGPGGGSRPIKEIMVQLNKGRDALTPKIGAALKADPPAWETIQGETQEVVRLATAMSQHEPAKGSKESWQKLTAEYTDSAQALDKAARAKDRDAALAAHDKLSQSCKPCHSQHR